jgi:hypothetical protein
LIKESQNGETFRTYLVALGVESVLQLDDVRVAELLHDLKFAILIPFILVNLLDRNNFTSFSASSLKSNRKQKVEFTAIYDMKSIEMWFTRAYLEDYAEGAVADDTVCIVRAIRLKT